MNSKVSVEELKPQANEISINPDKIPVEIDRELYCYCKMPDNHLLMIECSNTNCKIGWFHAECVSITESFSQEWYCFECICDRVKEYIR